MLEVISSLSGLGVGFCFGGLSARARFCLLGAVSDGLLMRHFDRPVFWLLTALTAWVITSFLVMTGYLDLSATHYLRSPFNLWPYAVGGSLFGIGMVLSSGCVAKQMIRLGSGYLPALLILGVVGVSAQAMLAEPLRSIRRWQPDVLTLSLNGEAGSPGGRVLIGLCLMGLLAGYAYRYSKQSIHFWSMALLLGALIPTGWVLSSWMLEKYVDWGDLSGLSVSIESLSYVVNLPKLFDWDRFWASSWKFGVALMIGTVLGAYWVYKKDRVFRFTWLHCFRDAGFYLIGAVLMGIGAVWAGGCSVGQGLTGLSTGALGSMVALGSMILSSGLMLFLVMLCQARRAR